MRTTKSTTSTTGRRTSPLLALRRRHNINQERLAALAGISRGWVGFVERNPEAMTRPAAEKLSRVLGVDAADLLPRRGEP
jgi:transcriptional regulator with XRE-family HTH domain